MWSPLIALLLLPRAWAEECPAHVPSVGVLQQQQHAVRPPRVSTTWSETIGLDTAKELLNEAVVLPARMDPSVAQLFRRSGEHSAVLLSGPVGSGKLAVAEAAAAEAGVHVLLLPATEVAIADFCKAPSDEQASVMVLIEGLETAPSAGLAIRRCLREVTASGPERLSRFFIVATMGRERSHLSEAERAPFGYVAQIGLPDLPQRKQYLLRLLQQISRVDAQWGAALRESAVVTLATLTASYTFAEIELVLRRAFIRSTNAEGVRDPVALHHFEKILEEMPPQATRQMNTSSSASMDSPAEAARAGSVTKKSDKEPGKKKGKDMKDPMDGIFGWCNVWLPEALHLPPVVWAMIIFGILAHFMARSTYQPYGQRKRNRGGPGTRSPGLFGDMGAEGQGSQFPNFGDQLNDWYPGGSNLPNFPSPPGMGASGPSASATAGGTKNEGAGAQPPASASKPSSS